MSLEITATYEGGVFRPEGELPLSEGQRVQLTVHPAASRARASYGLLAWKGDPAALDHLLGPDNLPGAEDE